MPFPRMLALRRPDFKALVEARDIKGLIRLLDHGDFDTQWRAARALGTMGNDATSLLLRVIENPNINIRLGAIEALASIRDPAAIKVLQVILASDQTSELRWAAALALGEIGDQTVAPALLSALRDEDRYVRYGAAKALEQIGLSAETDQDRAFYYIALQDWGAIKKLGKSATGPLIDMLKERHPAIRAQIIEILGSIGGVEAKRSCEQVLRDPDGDVRWRAVLSSKRCGVPTSQLPLGLSKRPRTGPSVFGATLLNFFFLGIGYDYLGKWWGLLLLEIYMLLIVMAQLQLGPYMPFIIAFPITALFAAQTFLMAKRESDLSG
jgi:HEAT repeat protein